MSEQSISVQGAFWTIASEHRAGFLKSITILDFYNIFTKAKNQGFSVNWRDIYPILKLINRKDSPAWAPPNFVIDFAVAYFKKTSGKNALDPCVGMGTFFSALSESFTIQMTGIVSSQEESQLVELIGKDVKVDWVINSSEEGLEEVNDEYDVVFSIPPFGLPRKNKNYEIYGEHLELNDSITNFIVLSASAKLSSSGKAMFLLPENFYNYNNLDGVVSNFAEFGLYISAIISLPQNSLFPWTALSTSLFFVGRQKVDNLFVGHLSEEGEVATLIDNLINRRNGRTIELGRLVNFDEYKSWKQYSLQLEVQGAIKNIKSPVVKIEEIASKINIGNETENGGFEELPNSVYLPLKENLSAVAKFSDLKNHPKNYVQIILKSDVALADYVAGYFNTDLGRKVRASLAYGNVVAKLLKIDLIDALVLLPSMDVQQEIAEAQRSIWELVLGLGKLEKDLFQSPDDVKKIEKQIIKLDQKESFERWVDTLPFPLATILWRYHASIDADEKIRHLLHFFEGTAQFTSTLMLSALYSDPATFSKHKQALFNPKDSSRWLKRSTFGNWVIAGRALSKITRNMLSSPQDIALCFSLYRTDSTEFIETIASKALFSTLMNTSKYRNDFAHGGIENSLENKRKLNLLESELNSLRILFSTTFDDFVLLKAISNQYRDGLYFNKISKVTGSRQVFANDTLFTSMPLDSNKLYFGPKDSKKPLEILPFIKLIPSLEGEDNACYFYNRLENDNRVRWVTYHHEKQPELISSNSDLVKLIESLEDTKDL